MKKATVRSEPRPATTLELDVAVGAPVAYAGLRKALMSLRALSPESFDTLIRERKPEFNCLLPGTFPEARHISDLAISPSERRLHKESEQVFRVLNLAASLIVHAVKETGRTHRFTQVGATDEVSLRGLMRAVEWARLEGLEGKLAFAGWSTRRSVFSAHFEQRRRELLDAVRRRMRLPLTERPDGREQPFPAEVPVDAEGRYLAATLDATAPAERRIAAGLLGARECFFSTNHEGALLALEQALDLLESRRETLALPAIQAAFAALDEGLNAPAVEIDRENLASLAELRFVLYRHQGVVHSFLGEYHNAVESFSRGLEDRTLSPIRRSELLNYRAVCVVKRLNWEDFGLSELKTALGLSKARGSDAEKFQEAWVRNGLALIYWRRKEFPAALEEVRLAAAAAGDLHSPVVAHAKINLLSNISVLQEDAKQLTEAIQTWNKFEKISSSWGPNFMKHYRYRLGGLHKKLGSVDTAMAYYAEAFEKTHELNDPFYGARIATELGAHALIEGDKAAAEPWFQKALDCAREMGEPYALALALAGLELARGGTQFGPVATAAAASSTYPVQAGRLKSAAERGDRDALLLELPRLRAKLNLPFAPVTAL
jgi:tetratricopeptide (TPR) repeat protein